MSAVFPRVEFDFSDCIVPGPYTYGVQRKEVGAGRFLYSVSCDQTGVIVVNCRTPEMARRWLAHFNEGAPPPSETNDERWAWWD